MCGESPVSDAFTSAPCLPTPMTSSSALAAAHGFGDVSERDGARRWQRLGYLERRARPGQREADFGCLDAEFYACDRDQLVAVFRVGGPALRQREPCPRDGAVAVGAYLDPRRGQHRPRVPCEFVSAQMQRQEPRTPVLTRSQPPPCPDSGQRQHSEDGSAQAEDCRLRVHQPRPHDHSGRQVLPDRIPARCNRGRCQYRDACPVGVRTFAPGRSHPASVTGLPCHVEPDRNRHVRTRNH